MAAASGLLELPVMSFMAEFPCRLSPATLRLKELIATRLRDASIHHVDERVEVASVDPLKNVYRRTLELLLA